MTRIGDRTVRSFCDGRICPLSCHRLYRYTCISTPQMLQNDLCRSAEHRCEHSEQAMGPAGCSEPERREMVVSPGAEESGHFKRLEDEMAQVSSA